MGGRVNFFGEKRAMGFEPTTNSLEGCDSTTELRPQGGGKVPRRVPDVEGGAEPAAGC
jgi:hypothetical protein